MAVDAGVDITAKFRQRYGAGPRVFRAPGRVNLIGDHTDYNDGFVLPAAIEFATRVAIGLRPDRTIEVTSENYSETTSFSLDDSEPVRKKHWSDYVRGVALMLQRAGHRVAGANLVIDGNVPVGSGLSSSAALEVSTAFALLANAEVEMRPQEIALLCQRVENEFIGVRSGIMDQFISCMGRAGHALLLDCRSLETSYPPLPGDVKLVICDTKVRRELASGEYNVRRGQCETAVGILGKLLPHVKSLRDLTEAELNEHRDALDPVIFRRCRHVVTENRRVVSAAKALERSELAEFGKLMIESHNSLRDDYEVSSPELDLLVSLALASGLVYGARMTGGGFGGCTINFVGAAQADEFARGVADEYHARMGHACAVYVCSSVDGAAEDRG